MALYSDDFNRDDGALGDDWDVLGAANLQIVSNKAKALNLGGGTAEYLPAGDLADCVLGCDPLVAGVSFRIQDVSNHYYVRHVGTVPRIRMHKKVAGVETYLGGDNFGGVAYRGTISVKCDGNVFTFFHDGDELSSIEDDTFSDGGIGIYFSIINATVDNFVVNALPPSMVGMIII